MARANAPPKGDPPIRVQTLHESERTRVARVFLPEHNVVRKEVLGPDREQRLRHELGILQRLRGVDGIAQLADTAPNPGSIMLEDVDGVCLADRAVPLQTGELIEVALGLAGAIAGMHRRGVVHRDISPANVVLSGSRQVAYLVDFALATSFAEIRPEFTHPSQIVGTLAYLAPEQTGRTGRPVDQRADLYGLGATLYELATGSPPFGAGDPLKLIHDHVTRVPIPPAEVNPDVPAQLSDIIMHLLAKEPDNRYQTADGVIHDLTRIRDVAGWLAGGAGRAPRLRVGEHDFPVRLRAPCRPVGRDAEIVSLVAAVSDATIGQRHGLLVSGVAGVGKTSLIDELRPIVAARDGWFVSGKFDQHRNDQEFDGVLQAFRSLGRLLLAEPEDQLVELRERILRVLGSNAGLISAVVPEFAALLGVPPDPGDPSTAQARIERGGVAILRAVASPKRPMVFVVDDLQWADLTPLGFIDLVISEQDLDGLLVVGAYRDSEVDATHPLTAMLSRWRHSNGPQQLRLDNLSPPSLATMVGDMLHLDAESAATLAHAIAPRTKGNPYDTIETLNALRRHRILVPTADGWRWHAPALAEYLGRANVADLLAERPNALPPPTRATLAAMACLGGRVELSLLRAATGHSTATLEDRIAPALDDGLLVLEPGHREAVRFRHDRLREVILLQLAPGRRKTVGLDMARRLAAVPELFAVAAEQYLPVLDAIPDTGEQRMVSSLLRRAAEQAKLLSNHVLVERLSAAAIRLSDPADTAVLIELHTRRHAALYSLGRLNEADEVYRTVDRLCTTQIQRVDATLVQISSLTHRNHHQEAIGLAVELLRQLGVAVPTPGQLSIQIDQRLDALYQWLSQTSQADDRNRPDISDPALLAAIAVIDRVMSAAHYADQQMMTWLSLEAMRMWIEHGPADMLTGPAAHVGFVAIARRQDYRSGYEAVRRLLAFGEARGYGLGTAAARLRFSNGICHWFEPLENGVRESQLTWDELLQGGDLAKAGRTCYGSVPLRLDSASSLESVAADVKRRLAFARRTGSRQTADWLEAYDWLVRVLRGEGEESNADHSDPPERYAHDQPAMVDAHITRALAAAVFGDAAELVRHTAAVRPLLPVVVGTYPSALAHLLQALALASQARATTNKIERDTILAELDTVIEWLSMRATDAPDNFLHLLRLAEAERAWAAGDFRTAASAFDAAQQEVTTRQRPWHQALILERAARFFLAHGMPHTGHALLVESRQEYLTWGATAKVQQLDWAYPALQTPADVETGSSAGRPDGRSSPRRSSIPAGTIDMLGTLAASQALSSETSIVGLRTRVEEILGTMTGATGIYLLLRSDDKQSWLLSAPGDSDDGEAIPIDEPGRPQIVPLSAIRYAERVRESLVVRDATRDDRFSRDPYFTDIDCCSLLVVPLLNRGDLQAMLLLENRLIRGAFSADRLDGVMLIAGQLAVSLRNAMLYASLEQKVADRTRELALANARLEVLSITDPLTGLANRRQLEEILDVEWHRAQRSGQPIALAMIDIDHFKLYNDQYGHAAGDKCLQRVATQLRNSTRDIDLVARYGGEEFAVVMPGTNLTAATQAAERIRTAVATLSIRDAQASEQIVTISIGVGAIVPRPDTAASSLVEAADAELYRAKDSGRNRVRATSALHS